MLYFPAKFKKNNKKTKKMHDGNDEQVLCLLTYKYLAFILRVLPGITKTKITIFGKHKTKV